MSGWIKLHRKITENPMWLDEPFTRGQAWIDLLLLANHKSGSITIKKRKIQLKRGQCGRSVLWFAARWKWSRDKVRFFIDCLKKEGQILVETDNVTTIITIENYDLYQEILQQKLPPADQSPEHPAEHPPEHPAEHPAEKTYIYAEKSSFSIKEKLAEHPAEHQPEHPAEHPANLPHTRSIRSKEDKEENNIVFMNEYSSDDKSPDPEKNKKSTIDFEKYCEIWNQGRENGKGRVLKLSRDRKNKIRSRLREDQEFLEHFEQCVYEINQCPFLRGENNRGWTPDFDWLIANDTNYLKILEGKYREKSPEKEAIERFLADG